MSAILIAAGLLYLVAKHAPPPAAGMVSASTIAAARKEVLIPTPKQIRDRISATGSGGAGAGTSVSSASASSPGGGGGFSIPTKVLRGS